MKPDRSSPARSKPILSLGSLAAPLRHTKLSPVGAPVTREARAERLLSSVMGHALPASPAIHFLPALVKMWLFQQHPEIHGILEIGPGFSTLLFSLFCSQVCLNRMLLH